MALGVIIAIVVAVLGGVIRFATSERGIGQMKRAFAAQRASGVEAGRAVIDKALSTKPYPERMAALALLGDRAALEREVGALAATYKTGYARAAGLLGLALLDDAPKYTALLAAHAAAFERDAPGIIGAIKKNVAGIAAIGAVLGGARSEGLLKLRPSMYAMNQPWLSALLWTACVRSFERDGKTTEAANARVHLTHLEQARAG